MKLWLDPHAPHTNFILGAALSGGDPIAAARMIEPGETMPRRCEVTFRGEEKTVVVDQYDADPETNALDVSWHFDGVTPAEHDALGVTDEEEAAIVDAIGEQVYDRSDLDDYDYHNDR